MFGEQLCPQRLDEPVGHPALQVVVTVEAAGGQGVDAVGVGDSSVAKLRFWRTGVLREYPANVKLALDVLRGAGPEVAEPPSRAVADALGR